MGANGKPLLIHSTLPPGLTNGENAVALTVNAHFDNLVYSGTTTGTKAELLAAISDRTEWSGSDASTYDLSTGGTSFPNSFTVVPECSTSLLVMLGSVGLPGRRRR